MAHSYTEEDRVRTIIREELYGIKASVDLDPVFTATTIIDRMSEALAHDDVDIAMLRGDLTRLREVLPDIVEEMNIVRDALAGI